MNKVYMTSMRNVPADWRFCNALKMSSIQSRSTPKPLVSMVASPLLLSEPVASPDAALRI